VKDVEFLDTLLLFNSWVSKMIFKNFPNLYTAITKNKGKVGSKRRVDDDTNSGTKKKTKTKQKPNNNMLVQEAIREKNLKKYAVATAESSTTTSTVSSTATSTTRNVIPPSPDKIVNHLVKLPYKIKSAKVGALVAMSIRSEGEKSPIPLRSFLLDTRIDNSFWHAYRLRKNESNGHLFCPFCSISCRRRRRRRRRRRNEHCSYQILSHAKNLSFVCDINKKYNKALAFSVRGILRR
jgi:aldehyde:ferredoxin oxidoreductase